MPKKKRNTKDSDFDTSNVKKLKKAVKNADDKPKDEQVTSQYFFRSSKKDKTDHVKNDSNFKSKYFTESDDEIMMESKSDFDDLEVPEKRTKQTKVKRTNKRQEVEKTKEETKKTKNEAKQTKDETKKRKNETKLSKQHDEIPKQKAKVTKQKVKKTEKQKQQKQQKQQIDNDEVDSESESDHDDWEEVEQLNGDELANYNPDIPQEGVQIVINDPLGNGKNSKKNQKDRIEEWNNYIRQHINRMRKELQLNKHNVSLLMLVARGIYLNSITMNHVIKGLAFSVLFNESWNMGSSKDFSINFLDKFSLWFKDNFKLEIKSKSLTRSLTRSPLDNFNNTDTSIYHLISRCFQYKRANNYLEYILTFVTLLRCVTQTQSQQTNVRLCYALNPIHPKPTDLLLSKNQIKRKTNDDKPSINKNNKSKNKSKNKSDNEFENETETETEIESETENNDESEDNECENNEINNAKNKNNNKKKNVINDKGKGKNVNRKNIESSSLSLSSSSSANTKSKMISNERDNGSQPETGSYKKRLIEFENWVEIYLPTEQKWVCCDIIHDIINQPYEIGQKLNIDQLNYVIGIDNYNNIRDVTVRYNSDWMNGPAKTRRINIEWWNETMDLLNQNNNPKQDVLEDNEFQELMLKKPLPTRLSDYKDHPLYVLKRHLLKFEAIYPPDAPPLGFFRNEPVYSRDCVHTLRSRDAWVREARVVKLNQTCYNMVKSRPRWNKLTKELSHDVPPLEVFGIWQTDPYIPPEAKDGIVPRGPFGNVDLFKPEMLPKGTVHIKLPGLLRIANKLNIDCAPAVVGFEGQPIARPVIDGFVVCEELKDILVDAWHEENVNEQKRQSERREKKVYANWKKLIKGLLIKQRLKIKYQDQDHDAQPELELDDARVKVNQQEDGYQ